VFSYSNNSPSAGRQAKKVIIEQLLMNVLYCFNQGLIICSLLYHCSFGGGSSSWFQKYVLDRVVERLRSFALYNTGAYAIHAFEEVSTFQRLLNCLIFAALPGLAFSGTSQQNPNADEWATEFYAYVCGTNRG